MGRHTCCFKQKLRKGLWSPEEDEKLLQHITKYGHGCWSSVPKLAGLQRCGKSCRLRWINYLRPDLKRGAFSEQEENLIIQLHAELGNRWSQIAAQLPGRTDNEIKNLWNSSIKKKLRERGIDPNTHKPLADVIGGEKSGTPSSSPDRAPPVGLQNPAAGYFAVNYSADSRTSTAGLAAETGAKSLFWFGQSSNGGTGFDCGSISSVLPPVASSTVSASTGIRPLAGLLQEASNSGCGGGMGGLPYWESGTSSSSSGTTGNSSSSIELPSGGATFLPSSVFSWRELAPAREQEHLPLVGELDELKWSDFLQSAVMPPLPTPLSIHQNHNHNPIVLDEFGNWPQLHRLPPPSSRAQLQQDQQQQNPLLQVQNQDMYSKDLQRISAAFGHL